MTKKILFLLTFLLTTIGGGNFALAGTRVGYTEANDDTNHTLAARSLSNGGLDHLTISDPIKGNSIDDYSTTPKGVYVGNIQYTNTNSWRKNEDTNDYSPNQYVGYTLTVGAGYRLNISKVAAKILVGDDSYTWKVEIENPSGTILYTSDPKHAGTTSQDALADDVSLSHLAGTVTVKLYMYQGGNQKYFSINYLQLEVTVEEVERYTKEFHVEDLRYCTGSDGINASQMEREVGGYHLSFAGGNGVKCNNYRNFSFQRHYETNEEGVMTIAMDANNTDKFIRQITLTAWGTGAQTLTPSDVSLSSGILVKTSGGDGNTNEVWTWTSTSDVTSVTFTCVAATAAKFDVYGIAITTLAQPTFTKSTPSIIFPDDQSILTSISNNLTVDLNNSTINPSAFLWDCVFSDGGTGVTRDGVNNGSPGVLHANTGNLNPGVATLTASFGGNYFFNDASQAYALIVNGVNPKPFTFTPDEIYLNVGKKITPYINYNQNDFDTSDLTFTPYPSDIVSTSIVNYQKESDRKLCKIVADGTSVAAGKTVVIAAKCKIANSSEYCYSTLKVHIKAAGSRNFEWMGPAEYTINKGDYMFIPGIIGNSSGNNSYSKASVNAENKSYVYRINRKTKTITWWRNDGTEKYYKIDEGCPDYRIVENNTPDPDVDNDVAYIFWNTGQGGDGIDTLMIYGNKAGDATLRAFDPQDHTIFTDVTIHVKDPDATEGVNKLNTTYVNNMTFPYTWDFTKNFSDSQLEKANPLYWEKKGDSYSMGIASSFNYDYADENGDGNANNNDNNDKLFSDGSALIPQLYGLKISLGNSSQGSWFSKRDRLRLNPSAGDGKPHLQIIGGSHKLYLPAPPSGSRPGETYKLLLKVKANGDQARIRFDDGAAKSMDVLYLVNGKDKEGNNVSAGTTITFETFDYEHKSSDNNSNWLKDAIFSYTVKPSENIILQLNNVDVYWIAYSTEEKKLNYPKTITYGDNSVTTGVTYAANTYSYNEDLDIVKSSEANQGVTAYYASNFTVDKDAAASSTGEGTQYAVKMTPANSLEYVTKNTGLLLKKNVTGDAAQTVSCYMIANPRNVESYSADDKIVGKNYLMGTGANSATVTGWKDGNTNFLMAYAYKYYTNLSDPNSAQGDYRFDRNWSFYPAMGDVTVPAQRAYLQVPHNVYVDREGNIVNMPSGSRSHRSGDTAEAPATKAMLSIVFDDEPLNDSGTTGISTVSNRVIDNDGWYTLQGVRVDAPSKGGIYIHKGRKFVVK